MIVPMSNDHITPLITSETLNRWALELGFQQLGVSDIELGEAENKLAQWLKNKFHGDMEWMQRHGDKRSRPALLEPGTLSIISVRMNYRPPQSYDPAMILNHPERAYISRYALGRDYHKVMRKRLQTLAKRIEQTLEEKQQDAFKYRVFVDSAPVMEKPIAAKAGLGWVGKHSNILNQEAGSWFFLGEIYTNLPLEPSTPVANHCGDCAACIDVCPTQAIIEPYVLDARRCISYLTIEHKGSIPLEFREAIGNRIYGCDDCQLVCPWNRFAQTAQEADFAIRNQLDSVQLLTLFAWSEDEFLKKMEGSPIRRIGYERWQRNLVIALGNAPPSPIIKQALIEKHHSSSELLQEHIEWALQRQNNPT